MKKKQKEKLRKSLTKSLTKTAISLMILSQASTPALAVAEELDNSAKTVTAEETQLLSDMEILENPVISSASEVSKSVSEELTDETSLELMQPTFYLALAEPEEAVIQKETFEVAVHFSIAEVKMLLPAGIEFSTQDNLLPDGGDNNQLIYDETTHTLIIKAASDLATTDLTIFLTAQQIGYHELTLEAVEDAKMSTCLTFQVQEEQGSASRTQMRAAENPIDPYKLTIKIDNPTFSSYSEEHSLQINVDTSGLNGNLINEGKIVVKLARSLAPKSFPMTSKIKSYSFDPVENTVTYLLNDGITQGNQFSIALPVVLSGSAEPGQDYTVTATATGKDREGMHYIQQESILTGINAPNASFAPATSDGYRLQVATNVSVTQGKSAVQYTDLYRKAGVATQSFKNLVVEYDFTETVSLTDGKLNTDCITRVYSEKIDSKATQIIERTPERYSVAYGQVNGHLGNTSTAIARMLMFTTAPKDLAPATYPYTVRVYDMQDDGTQKFIASTDVNYVVESNDTKVKLETAMQTATAKPNEIATVRTVYNSKGGYTVPEAYFYFNIEDGLALVDVVPHWISGDGVKVLAYEYTTAADRDSNWLPVSKEDLEAVTKNDGVTAVRMKFIVGAQANVSMYANYRVNSDTPAGTEYEKLGINRLVFTDPDTAELKDITPSSEAGMLTIIDDYSAPATMSGGLYDNITGVVYNGETRGVRLAAGVAPGAPANKPYLFAIVPQGATFHLNSTKAGLLNSNNLSYQYLDFLSSEPGQKSGFDIQSQVLADGSTLYYIALNDGSYLRGHDELKRWAGLFASFNLKFQGISNGVHKIYYGYGDGDAGGNTNLTPANGSFIVSDLEADNPEVYSHLQNYGIETPAYIAKVREFTVGKNYDIGTQTQVSVDGSNYVDASSELAQVMPAQKAYYKIGLTNSGTEEYEKFEFVDVLPYVGDTMLISHAARKSTFGLTLSENDNVAVYIDGTLEEEAIITYNITTTPPLFDGNGDDIVGTGIWDPNPSNKSKAKSLKVELPNGLKPAQKVELYYTVTVPKSVIPRDDSMVAYNTVAYRGSSINGLIVGESAPAGVTPKPELYSSSLSGKAFIDLNRNGELDDKEMGLNGVQLELWKKNSSGAYERLSNQIETSTDQDDSGENLIGEYSFLDLSNGNYKIKVKLPQNGTFTKTEVGGTYGIQIIDNETGWLSVEGKAEFELDDVVGVSKIENLNIPVFMTTPINANIVFVDREGNVVNTAAKFGQGYKVELKKNGKILKTGFVDSSGRCSLADFTPITVEDYEVVITKPNGSKLTYSSTKNNDDFDLESNIYSLKNVTPGQAKNLTIYITDENHPYNGKIDLVNGYGENEDINPESATVSADDDETEINVSWQVTNGSSITYTGTGQTVEMKSYLTTGDYKIAAVIKDAANNEINVTKKFQVLKTNPTVEKMSAIQSFEVDIDTPWTKTEILDKFGIHGVDGFGNTLTADNFSISGTIDYTKPGDYPIKVTAEDVAENKTTIEVTIKVIFRKINVTYMVGNDAHATNEVAYKATLTPPEEPIKNGHQFDGWFSAPTDGNKWDFDEHTAPATDMTLHAQFSKAKYMVTFKNQSQTTINEVRFEELITKPVTNPTKAGYAFDGWYHGSIKWDFDTMKMPARNVILNARFIAQEQTITFDVNGGDVSTEPENIVQVTDSQVDLENVAKPTRSGYSFVGWFNGAQQVSGTFSMPADGLELKAHWTADKQVIQFNTEGGTGVDSLLATIEETINLDEQITTRAGYTFLGWYDESNQFVSGIQPVVIGGATYTAKWEANEQIITFDLNGGNEEDQPEDLVALTDEQIDLTQILTPSRAGYIFLGWFDADGNQYEGTFTMPAGGLGLIAQWEQNLEEDSKNNDNLPKNEQSVTKKEFYPSEQTSIIKNNAKNLPKAGTQLNSSVTILGILMTVATVFIAKRRKKERT